MPSKLILPGDIAQRKQSLQLYVPRGHESQVQPGERIGRCLVPDCGAIFFKGEEAAWQRHVGECARANMDKIEELAAEHRREGSVWDENNWDPEAAAHLQGPVKEAMLREGRMTLKPNERVGT